jgi:Zn-dependent protease with chaperone function
MSVETSHERPLTPLAKAGLIASTAAVILVFYLLAFVAGFLLIALLVLELFIVLAALRFGLAGWMIRIMEAHVRIVTILFRSLWLSRNEAEYRILLAETDAPQLFGILRDLCGRFSIRPPDQALLQMGVSAWVHLKGYRTGAGHTRLGLGYDLLCGLTISEVEAVLAHEMAHAKLVQRGFKQFAGAALSRCATLVGALTHYVRGAREAKADHAVASLLLGAFALLIRALARLVAAYSRQDEFEADAAAAQVCGPNSLRSSLLKLDAIQEASSRLTWRERVAQLQSGGGFTEWFGRELGAGLAAPVNERHHLFDPYATHPNLPDRLAALPPDAAQPLNSAAGVTLLAKPDKIAERLIVEIHRVAAIEEEKDSKAVSKWARRQLRGRNLNWIHLFGVAFCILGGIMILFGIIDWREGLIPALLGVGACALGVFIYRLGRYRDPREFPIPDYSHLVKATRQKFTFDRQDAMLREFEGMIADKKGRKRKREILLEQAYSALANADYLRAHVATRLCLKQDGKNKEAHMAFAVAAASVNQIPDSMKALHYVQSHTSFSSPSTAWAAAWTFVLVHEFALAEALLQKLLAANPSQKTFWSMIALARSRRGKINSAIVAARHACTPSPPSKEHAILLISLLIDAGLLREASTWLNMLSQRAAEDIDVQFETLRLKILQRDFAGSDAVAQQILQTDESTKRLMQIGSIYQHTRRFEVATSYFDKILARGHYPEALVALGEIAAEQRDKPKARQHLLSAINLKSVPAEDAVHPARLFQRVLAQLSALEHAEHCQAWTALLPATAGTTRCHEALRGTQFTVYGASEGAVKEYLSAVLLAADSTYPVGELVWKKSPKDEQPVRPVRPGVQRVTAMK